MSFIVCTFCFQIEYVSRNTYLIDQALKSFHDTALSLSCIERNIQLPPQIEFYASLCANDSILFCQDINTVEGLNRAAEADLMIRRAHGDRSRESGRDAKKKAVKNRHDKLKLEHPDEDITLEAAASSLGRDAQKEAVKNRHDKLKLEHPDEDITLKEAASSFAADAGRASLGVAKKPDESGTPWMMLESLSLVLFQPRATQTKSNLITVLHYNKAFGSVSARTRVRRFNEYYTTALEAMDNSHEFPIENPLWRLSLSKSRPEGVSNEFTQEEFNATAADRLAVASAKNKRKAVAVEY